MQFQIGIAVSPETPSDIFVGAVAWYNGVEPGFSTRLMTLPFAKNNFPALAIVHGYNIEHLVNAVCNRIIEKLLIKNLVCAENPLKMEVLTDPCYTSCLYKFPTVGKKNHWLISTADTIVGDWVRGIR